MNNIRHGHSADVSMHLQVNGHSMRIAQMGPDFLLIYSDADYPSGVGRIFLKIDDCEREWDVFLPDGIAAGGRQEVRVALAVINRNPDKVLAVKNQTRPPRRDDTVF